jgi:hypothetical protein
MFVTVDLQTIFHMLCEAVWFTSMPNFTCLAPIVHWLWPSNCKLKKMFAWSPWCYFIICKYYLNKSHIPFKDLFLYVHFRTLHYDVPVLHSPHKFAHPPFVITDQEIKEYHIRAAANGITFIPHFLTIDQLVQRLKWVHTNSMVISNPTPFSLRRQNMLKCLPQYCMPQIHLKF